MFAQLMRQVPRCYRLFIAPLDDYRAWPFFKWLEMSDNLQALDLVSVMLKVNVLDKEKAAFPSTRR
jgi:hypothetical protein